MSLEERFDRFATNYDKDAVQQVCQELFDQEMDYFNLHDDQTLTLSVILAQLLYSNNLFVNHGRFFFGIWVNAFVRLYPSLYRVPSDEQLSAYILMNFLQFFAYVFDYEKVAIEIECEVVSFVPNLFDRDELLIIWHGKQVRFADTKKIKDALQTAFVKVVSKFEAYLDDPPNEYEDILPDLFSSSPSEDGGKLEMIVKHFMDAHSRLMYKVKFFDKSKFVSPAFIIGSLEAF